MDKVLVLFSGGIDSTAALYKCLAEGYRVHAHHVNIKKIEPMLVVEQMVCTRIVRQLRKMGYEFEYSESNIDVPAHCWDLYHCWYVAGILVQRDKEINLVTTGRNATDIENVSPEVRAMYAKLFETVYRHGKKRRDLDCSNLPIIAKLTKREVWDLLPRELQELTWSCRSPVYGDGHVYTCSGGGCRSCTERKELGIKNENYSF